MPELEQVLAHQFVSTRGVNVGDWPVPDRGTDASFTLWWDDAGPIYNTMVTIAADDATPIAEADYQNYLEFWEWVVRRGSPEDLIRAALDHVQQIAQILPIDEEADARADKWMAARNPKRRATRRLLRKK